VVLRVGRVWGNLTREDLERRNGRIHELWAMGYSRREIAQVVDLSPARISQIIADFGATFR
jgi:DNA-binding CsgD family transcriptional regulator